MEYRGYYIIHDEDGFRWEDVGGVVYGDEFRSIGECQEDIDSHEEMRDRARYGVTHHRGAVL